MDENTLIKAQEIKAQIDNIDSIESAFKRDEEWDDEAALLLCERRPSPRFLCSYEYAILGGGKSVILPASLNDRILELLKAYKAELEKEFERL